MHAIRKFINIHKSGLLLSLVVFSALVPRLILFSMDVVADNDVIDYGESGKSLVENGKFEVFGKPLLIYPPLFPIAIGIVDHFYDNLLFSARFTSLFFGLAIVFMIYAAAKKLFGNEAGLFAAFFVAANPSFIIYSQEAQSESLYIFLILSAFFVYLELSEKYRINLAILLGSLIAGAYLTRPEGMLFLILPFFIVSLSKKWNMWERVICFALILFSFSVVSLPYWHYLYRHTGELSLTQKTDINLKNSMIFDGTDFERLGEDAALEYEKNLAHYNEETNTIEFYGKSGNLSLGNYFTGNTDELAGMYMKSLNTEAFIILIDNGINIILIAIVMAIFFFRDSGRNKRHIAAMAIIAVLYMLILPFFHLESRYLLQTVIFIVLIASFGYSLRKEFELNLFGLKVPGNLLFSGIRGITLMMICIQLVASVALFSSNVRKNDYFWEYKLAGEFIRKDSEKGKDTVIMSRNKNIVSYYADTEYKGVKIPYTSAENVIRFAKANKVDYIVIDKRFLEIRENYEELANIDRFSDEAELVYEDNSVYPLKVFRLSHSK